MKRQQQVIEYINDNVPTHLITIFRQELLLWDRALDLTSYVEVEKLDLTLKQAGKIFEEELNR